MSRIPLAMSDEQVKEKLQAFIGWELQDGQLVKTYSFADFMTALDMVNKIGVVAEHYNHHPDMLIKYNKVTFMLSTHSEGGVTEKDFQILKEIDKLMIEYI